MKIIQPLLGYMRQKYGTEAVHQIAVTAGLSGEEISKPTTWVSHSQFEQMLVQARSMVASDEEFLEANAYEMEKLYGPILLVLRTTTPLRMFEIIGRTSHFVSHISGWKVVEGTRTSARLRYESSRRESRLACLSRQAWIRGLPPLWGLPRADLREESCMAKGDDACIYSLRWYEATRLGPALLGFVVALLVAWAHNRLFEPSLALLLTLPSLGAMLGLLLETRRAGHRNLEYGDQTHRSLEVLGDEYANAMKEVLELHQRQQDWNHVLEEQIAERQATLERVAGQVSQLREKRQTTLRTISHDLRSPLQVVRFNGQALRDHVGANSEALEILDDIDHSLDKTDRLFKELMTFANTDAGLFEIKPETIQISSLADRLRGALKALVIRREIRVSVFHTREAPDTIETDRLLFNRIVDNIVTNAAKYTKQGSIVVEIGGTPDALCLKVSDTGRGITNERLEKVFTVAESDANPLIGDSYGLGLAIVVRLLDQVGGRLEVMSRPDQGTTFWIYFPLSLPAALASGVAAKESQEPMNKIMERVVRIRLVANENG